MRCSCRPTQVCRSTCGSRVAVLSSPAEPSSAEFEAGHGGVMARQPEAEMPTAPAHASPPRAAKSGVATSPRMEPSDDGVQAGSSEAERMPSPSVAFDVIQPTQLDPHMSTTGSDSTSGPAEFNDCVPSSELPSCSRPTSSPDKEAVNSVSVLDISPLPKAPTHGQQGRKRTAQASEIITGSPFKNCLLQKEDEMNKKLAEKEMAKKRKADKAEQQKLKSLKKAKVDKEAGDKPATSRTAQKRPGADAVQKTAKQRKSTGTQKKAAKKSAKNTAGGNEKYFCLVCGESFDGDWVQCDRCKNWAHEECADFSNPLYYYCDNCQP